MSRAITITSGKGGVGKSSISLNLALQLSRTGHRTCLFDADLGLANINILLGLQPEKDLKDILFNGRPLRDIIIEGPEGLDILPGSSGLEEMADLPAERMGSLVDSFSTIEGYDFLVFDTSAGISKNVVAFCLASHEVILVITPEPTSLTDAFALLKVLAANGFKGEAKIIMNQCKNAEVAKLIYRKFKSASLKYLERDVTALGVLYLDDHVTEAVKRQKPFLSLYPDSSASKCIVKLAARLTELDHFGSEPSEGFWKRCLDFLKAPLELPRKKKEGQREGVSLPLTPGGLKLVEASRVEAKEGAEARGEVSPTAATEKTSSPSGLVTEPSLLPLLEKLTDGLLSVSKELRLVREAMGYGNGRTRPHPGRGSSDSTQEKEIVHLDLYSFIKNRTQ